MLHRSHLASVTEVGGNMFRGSCSCGFLTKRAYAKIQEAADAAVAHSKAKGCGKHRFSEAEAKDALLQAKIAYAVAGNGRRREQRTYQCDFCNAWHLTSQAVGEASTG